MAKLEVDLLFSRDRLYNQRKYVPLHYHNEIELYLLLKGKVTYFIDNKTFLLNEGDLVLIPKHIPHSTDTEECRYNERLLISFNDYYFSKSVIPYMQELFKERVIHIPKENLTLIENMFYQIESEYKNKTENSEVFIKLYISELILYLHRYRILNDTHKENTDELMQQVIQYINLNFENEISLTELAKLFGFTESYFSKRFKSAVGICLSEYINYVRIKHAKHLLKTEQLPITEVALRCGFNDSSYFSGVFKKIVGVTPYKFFKDEFVKRQV